MASAFSHGGAALGRRPCFYRARTPNRVWGMGVLCSVIPDLDVIGFRFGFCYEARTLAIRYICAIPLFN
jgi:inner membrane protein